MKSDASSIGHWAMVGLLLALFIAPAIAQPALSPATTMPLAAGEERVKITVVEVVRLVRVRQTESEPYQLAKVGMVLDEGAEFQTGVGARVRVSVPPDQIITIDRLTTCKVLRARVAEGGNVARTEMGMEYGRTQYQVEAAGVEHDAAIRSPGATLAVRGTKDMVLYDHGPFPPVAMASQPVELRNLRRQVVRFGQTGRSAVVRATDNSPAETELEASRSDPRPALSNSPSENAITTYLGKFPGVQFKDLGALTLIDQNRLSRLLASAIVTLPVDRSVQFQLRWFNIPFADVNFSVVAPNGQAVSLTNKQIAAGLGTQGFYRGGDGKGGNGVASKSGFGAEIIEFPNGFPTGNYTMRAQLNAKGGTRGTVDLVRIDLQFNVIQVDPSNEKREPVILTLTGDQINPRNPQTVSRTVFVDTDVVREVGAGTTGKSASAKAGKKAKKPGGGAKVRKQAQPRQRQSVRAGRR